MLAALLSVILIVVPIFNGHPLFGGGGIIDGAAPVVMVPQPPVTKSIYIVHLECSAVDGIDNADNVVTLNDTKATTMPLSIDMTMTTQKDFDPPLQFPAGTAATATVSQPSVVHCMVKGYLQ